MNFRKIVFSLKKHLPTILSITSAVGTVASVALATKATSKAVKIIDALKEENPEATKKDIVKAVYKVYIPTAICTIISVAGNISGNAISVKRQATLGAAFVALNKSFDSYKAWVKEHDASLDYCKYLEEKLEEAEQKKEIEYVETEILTHEKVLFYNPFDKNNRYIVSTLEDFNTARYEFNRLVATLGVGSLYEFFELWSPKTPDGIAYNGPSHGHLLGWCTESNFIAYACPFVDMSAKETRSVINDMPVYEIEFDIEPYARYDWAIESR